MAQRKTPTTGTEGKGAITAVSGCFTYESNFKSDVLTAYLATGDTSYYIDRVHLDASNSSSIFGAANTIQPPALVLLPQIKF